MACQQTFHGSHKMDPGLRPTFGKIDFIHSSSSKWSPTILSCGQCVSALSTGLFQNSDFAGDLEHSKSSSGGVLCIFGSRIFVPISWMSERQTFVSHSSTESEIISLDAGLRMDRLLALDLWDVVIEVLRSTNNTEWPVRPAGAGQEALRAIKPRPKHQPKGGTEMLINCQMWNTHPQTHILFKASLSCTS